MVPKEDQILSDFHGNILILGAGPAGMSCALWLKKMGFRPWLVDRAAHVGGQLLSIQRENRWVLGFPNCTYTDIAECYRQHVCEEEIDVVLETAMTHAERRSTYFRIELQTQEAPWCMDAVAIVIATGVRIRVQEALPQGTEYHSLIKKGRLFPFPHDHLSPISPWCGKHVAVLGGGDNAHYTVHDLSEHTSHVHLLMRSVPKAQRSIRKKIEKLIHIGIVSEHTRLTLKRVYEQEERVVLTFENTAGSITTVTVDYLFIRAGFLPNTECLTQLGPLAEVEKNGEGYLVVDSGQRTSQPWVYGIGDVANPSYPSVVSALSTGAVAAKTFAYDHDRATA